MAEASPEVTAVLLAKGFCELYDRAANDGSTVQQDASLPLAARRALSMLSGLSLSAGIADDLGASVHVVMDLACGPFLDWGLPQFRPPFRHADVVLVERDLGVPTADCRELARAGGSEAAALEEFHHEALRMALKEYPARERARAYTGIREFVVRNPAVREEDLHRFVVEGGHAAAARTIMSFYRPVPQAALHGGVGHRCAHCGSLLWPDRDAASFPVGRCRIRQCRLANPSPAKRDDIADPGLWRLGSNAILAYWVGPGLDEIRIHDALRDAGRKVALYPQTDAADVGVDGLDVGIDVKTYASPVVLAARLSRSIGRLDMFARRILAVPDDKLALNPRYLQQLRDAYQGQHALEFMTSSQAIRELSR
ncbi:hypothetical protein FBZ82_10158 [Azospirillum brasilense]|uniref:REase associating with pPIWI RE domain-containing protein n=1 Tax=Azospirillum brasilense TaxID=192 RepID=A0A560BN51_AZOBR|nr:hypothetical protein [Azospirillum brasilense]TWA74045.1 hypothetical protein FBZ82_10158 [Azospirillum brasilense]